MTFVLLTTTFELLKNFGDPSRTGGATSGSNRGAAAEMDAVGEQQLKLPTARLADEGEVAEQVKRPVQYIHSLYYFMGRHAN